MSGRAEASEGSSSDIRMRIGNYSMQNSVVFFFQAEDGIRDVAVTGVQTCALPISTSVIGALKRGLTPLQKELGIYVCGGRGKHSRQTPQELVSIGDRVGFDGQAQIGRGAWRGRGEISVVAGSFKKKKKKRCTKDTD